MKKFNIKSYLMGLLTASFLLILFGFRYGDVSDNEVYDLIENKMYYNSEEIYENINNVLHRIDDLESMHSTYYTNDDIMEKLDDVLNKMDNLESDIQYYCDD